MDKKILDVTCGARTIWFDKHHPAAVYCDQRREEYRYLWKNARNCSLNIDPDVLCDFTEQSGKSRCLDITAGKNQVHFGGAL